MDTKITTQIDKGRAFDWGRTSADYARHRPGPPASFYEKLAALGVGHAGQRLLDLGTGTGLLALEFARRGAKVIGMDVATNQIAEATRQAREAGFAADMLDYKVGPAEKSGLPAHSFDVITANQCWLYFDHEQAIQEVRRLLAPQGLLVISHFSWIPRACAIAKSSEDLILKFNPDWTGANWPGVVPPFYPQFLDRQFTQMAMFQYDENIPFTHESWRGRIRACRGVGAALSPDEVEAFDREHQQLLTGLVPDHFEVLHRVFAHIMTPF